MKKISIENCWECNLRRAWTEKAKACPLKCIEVGAYFVGDKVHPDCPLEDDRTEELEARVKELEEEAALWKARTLARDEAIKRLNEMLDPTRITVSHLIGDIP